MDPPRKDTTLQRHSPAVAARSSKPRDPVDHLLDLTPSIHEALETHTGRMSSEIGFHLVEQLSLR